MPEVLGFFTDNGSPKTGLSATIRIRRVDTGALVVTDSAMTEVGDGAYSFDFDVAAGYSETLDFSIRLDGSATLADIDRFKFGGNQIPIPSDDDFSVRMTAAGLETDAVNEIRDSILSDSTSFPGANIDAAISSRAAPGAAMDLVANAVDAAAIATAAIDADAIATDAIGAAELALSAVNEIRDAILSDSIPFAGANVNATISSRSSHSAADAADAVWDENIVAAHGTADTAGRALRTLDGISDRVNNSDLNSLLGVADSVGVDLPEQINTELETTQGHGAGAWTSAGITAGAIADAVWDEDIVAAHGTADTAGRALRTLDAISDRANNSNLNALLGVADSAGVDLPEQINTELETTQGHGAGTWTTGAMTPGGIADAVWDESQAAHVTAGSMGKSLDDKAEPGDAMDLVTDAVDTAALATTGVNEIRDSILSDATKFAGANIDTTISSRAAPGAAMDLVANAVDAAAIATDAIDADSLATDAINEIQAGLATATAVTALQTTGDRIEGLVGLNHVLAALTKNANGDMLTGRLRHYNTQANALTDNGTTGLLDTYDIVATYDGSNSLNGFTMTRVGS